MNRTRVKFCGITRVEDARAASALGADAIGLNFYPPSPRAIDVARARAVAAVVSPFVTTVGLFVNPEPEAVRGVLEAIPLNVLQFHGDESREFCESFGRPYIKAIRVKRETELSRTVTDYPSAGALLLDAFDPKLFGGSGRVFDWTLVPAELDRPVILAGGLTADNVAEAIRAVRPAAVDVSGGVESAPGIKDAQMMAAFIREVDRGTAFERED